MADIHIYSEGLCYMSVCVPKGTAIEDIEKAVNLMQPTGISSKWKISTDKFFNGGKVPNPCPCESDKLRVHYLLNC